MNQRERIIRSGRFKGKRIEFAATTGVDMFREIADEFMQKLFQLEPGDYLISDESSLHDFTGLGVKRQDIESMIMELYAVDVSDLESGNLLEIFARIQRAKYGAPS
ncbi:MAG: hypothetical protein QME66_08740 [Candidatus Eisenbacteria bacterium]|nr:hypothetical protein [Candidatus Eisenbacteria bacterium]